MKGELPRRFFPALTQHLGSVGGRQFSLCAMASLRIAWESKNRDWLEWMVDHPQLGLTSHFLTPHLNGTLAALREYDHQSSHSASAACRLRTVVLSVAGSQRRAAFQSNWTLGGRFEFFDGANATSADWDYTDLPDYRHHLTNSPTAEDLRHLACTLSHFRIWRELESDQEWDCLLILEDDALPVAYGQWQLQCLLDSIPEDADIVFVNGRSADKISCQLSVAPPYEPYPDRLLYHRHEVVAIMTEHFEKLCEYQGKKVHWSGTDGYMLTRTGIRKLVEFINAHGLPPLGPSGGETNLDILLGLLTVGRDHLLGRPAGFNSVPAQRLNLFTPTPYLTGYVSSLPLVDCLSRFDLDVAAI